MNEYVATTEEIREYVEEMLGWEHPEPGDVFDRWLAEVERAAAEEAWESGVATALNYAKRGSDGISLKLVTFEGEAWTNPYRRSDSPSQAWPVGGGH